MFRQFLELQSQLLPNQAGSLPVPLFDQLHPEWQEELQEHKELIDKIDQLVQEYEITPAYDHIFKALNKPIVSTRVVFFGQDPYPKKGHAHGLAFSVDASVTPLPASLRNIFKELKSDVGIDRTSGDLSDWCEQGVMLINRVLTTEVGQSLAHAQLGWQEVTNSVARVLGNRGVLAVLWGNSALELRSYFAQDHVIASVHPSPLSAYRGFFGSKPFSQVNEKLLLKGYSAISW
jgi:uracil-DNA glycosylase